jgi:hypothetical protein
MYNRLKSHRPASIKYQHNLGLERIRVAYVKSLYSLLDLLANLDGISERSSGEYSLSTVIIA